MADKKITQLTNITGANLVDADEFVVVDISADETKAITLGELKEAFDSGSGFVRTTGDTMTGDLALSGADITFGDNDKAIFGAGSDLQIYHDDSNSYIDEVGTGSLRLRGYNQVRITDTSDNIAAIFKGDAESTLYHNNSAKLATSASGIDVTGNANFADNGKAIFGAGSDLQIWHNGTHSFIADAGTGNMYVRADGSFNVEAYSSNEPMIRATKDGSVDLYYDGGKKLITTSTGIDVTGDVGADTATITGKTTTDELDLSPIASTIEDTAVDVFVYDTSKDSDGGAWRKRTQGTSWYNETLNTATRGSRKEFPAVAVIVAEQGDVTIYDGDDPDLPMWMVFQSGGGWNAKIIAGTTATNNLAALNGMLSIGTTPNSQGVLVVSFIEDMTRAYLSATNYGGTDTAPLSLRNTTGHTFAENVAGGSNLPVIVNNSVNDVAMTVLPNAPIDAATGLPVPTIAVATDGGYSIIKDDGTVVDGISAVALHLKVEKIQFTEDHMLLYGGFDYDLQDRSRFFRVDDILSSDTTITTNTNAVQNSAELYGNSSNIVAENSVLIVDTTNGPDNNYLSEPHLAASGKELRFGNSNGAYKVARNKALPSAGLSNKITSTYNTGWMNGDIKLATLSDTDDTDVTGSELVTNGTFDSDISGWTDWSNITNSSAASQSGGKGILDGSIATPSDALQDISVVAGKTYVVSLTMQNNSGGSGRLYISDGANFTYAFGSIFATPTETTFSKTIKPTQSTVRLYAYNTGSGSATFDNISVRLAEEDRSVNGNGLQVFGSITKNPVASGADLVAYSGFSNNENYLQQPYNSELDVGTGDFSVMLWVKRTTNSSFNVFISRGEDSGNNRWAIYIDSNNQIKAAIKEVTEDPFSSGYTLPQDTWTCVCLVRSNAVAYLYVNGELTTSGSANRNLTNTSGTVKIGVDYDESTAAANISVALARISATAPSPEQIKKIYEDEKHLFQENAQATLYGSSDAVTALAYDDSTELLHVGTSAGRSDFQGLRRVNNTTNAVGAAISASNGMIVEE